jgi:retinol-binding protein 3
VSRPILTFAARTALALAAALPCPAAAEAPSRREVAEAVAATVQSVYVFPGKGAAAARLIRRRAASGVYDRLATAKAFVEALTSDLYSVTRDKHLVVRWSAAGYPAAGDALTADPAVRANELRQMKRSNYSMARAEVLAGNVGYLKIDQFHAAEDAGATLSAAMAFLANTDALIFDLRNNRGGDSAAVALAISYLVPPQTHLVSFQSRGGAKEAQSWSVPFVLGGPWSTSRAVYVLTSEKTFSAGEEFAYDLQQLKRATIIGVRSRGGANPGVIQPISDHFRMFVPNEAAINPITGTNWEGVGVVPDVIVAPAQALATAHRLALEALLAKANAADKPELEEALAGLSEAH